MMFTEPMKLLSAAVLASDSDKVSNELLRLGALDFVSTRELDPSWGDRLKKPEPGTRAARVVELRKRVEGFIAMAREQAPLPAPTVDDLAGLDPDAVQKSLDSMASEMEGVRERQKELNEDLLKLEEIRRQVELFDGLGGVATSGGRSFLAVRTGSLPTDRVAELERALEPVPSVLLKSAASDVPRVGMVIVSLKRDEARLVPLLRSAGWEDAAVDRDAAEGKAQTLRGIQEKAERLRVRQAGCSAELDAMLAGKLPRLSGLWASLRANELSDRVRASFSRTERAVVFTGWITADRQAAVEAGIRQACEGRCHVEWQDPDRGDAAKLAVPVSLRNPAALKPFEVLVQDFATPEYGTVDPTPFVAVTYLMMFGLMFGDAGHGLVLVVLGILGTLKARATGAKDSLYRLIAYCGVAAMVTGVLFGSYFGFPLLPPLWFGYHEVVAGGSSGPVDSIYGILGITIKFGMGVLGLGLVLNWINLARKKRWVELVLDKGGLAGGWIYAVGAWVAFGFSASGYRSVPNLGLALPLLLVPTIAVALKAPLEFIEHRRHGKGERFNAFTIVDFVMEWVVEILEIYSGYLANTLSFMRVAGLGIAHVSLMVAFSQIASDMAGDGPWTIVAWLVYAIGNVLVVALEGLSAYIQALRLNYYEFFSKFFSGTGKAYNPVSLRSRD